MNDKTVLLVNPNLMRPPVAPIGLEYVASSLKSHGCEPAICDLTFADDWQVAMNSALTDTKPLAICVSIRDIDDAYFASKDFVLGTTTDIIQRIMEISDAPVILGGIGFSFAPCEVLEHTGATYGIHGDGEEALPMLLASLDDVSGVPGAVYRDNNGQIIANPSSFPDLGNLPTPSRRFFDNKRYFAEGGQAGIETKRGCNQSCIYCCEPAAKGRRLRLRRPESIVEEVADLFEQGIDVYHLCDSEFNLPLEHAHGVCKALSTSGLGGKIRWYAYASPAPFDKELASAMKDAGCAGINFGVDHTNPDMLRRLGRNYGPEDLRNAVKACREADIAVMFDMLFGSPGETRETLAEAIEFMREIRPDRVGLSCGVRIYPNTPLAKMVQRQGDLANNPNLHGTRTNNENLLKPIFYVDAALGEDIHTIVSDLVDGDELFLHADPNQVDGNYNYNDNSTLSNAIKSGARGAYWDVLKRIDA